MDGKRAAWDSGDLSGHHLDVSWKMDPVLELWVDVARRPTSVRLRGMLDHQTGHSVLGVMEELLGDGHLDVLVDVGGLEVRGSDGFATLVAVEQAVRRAGGRSQWANWSDLRITADVAEGPGEEEQSRLRQGRDRAAPVRAEVAPAPSSATPTGSNPAQQDQAAPEVGASAGTAAKLVSRRPPARRSRGGRVVPVTISGAPGGLAS